jgi:hypothetical protein
VNFFVRRDEHFGRSSGQTTKEDVMDATWYDLIIDRMARLIAFQSQASISFPFQDTCRIASSFHKTAHIRLVVALSVRSTVYCLGILFLETPLRRVSKPLPFPPTLSSRRQDTLPPDLFSWELEPHL